MNRMQVVLMCAAILTGATELRSQEEKLVRFPSEPASWTIDVTRLSDASAETHSAGDTDLRIEKIIVAQNDRKLRQLVTYSDGKTRESWGIAGLSQFLTEDSGGTVYFSPDAAAFDGSIFDWVLAENQVEKEPVKFLGRLCIHYKIEKLVNEDGVFQGTLKLEAWIDPVTRFPVAFQNNLDRAIYTFGGLTGPLVIPERFARPLESKRRMLGIKQPIN